MLLRLSKNAYVRQYGPFTYVIERIKNFDQVYLDAEVFFRWLTREPMEIAEVLGKICKVYEGADQFQINQDFNEFIVPLIRAGVLANPSHASPSRVHGGGSSSGRRMICIVRRRLTMRNLARAAFRTKTRRALGWLSHLAC